MWDYRARRSDKPNRADDGDTVLMIVDLGMGVFSEQAIRLKGCFAPEHNQPGGKEAAKFLALALSEVEERARARQSRWPFIVVTEPNTGADPEERRSFVRFIGSVFAADTQESINAEVVEFLAANPQWGHGIGSDDG